ncbi:acetyl-CoA carboxylase 1-like [Primulina huaijiensis]|uniref:acetyl-CoA carboxylase 1-like n=1 Tax=Primulina huaijiensis TaxID=1492673 RepID=UPI003CC79938
MDCKGFSKQQNVDFPAKVLHGILNDHLNSCLDKEKGARERVVEPLVSLVKSYEGGLKSHACLIVQGLFDEYLSVEELFGDDTQVDVSERLRHLHKKDLRKVVDLVLSHQSIGNKNKLILSLLERLVYYNPTMYRDQLIRLSALNNANYYELAIKSNKLLGQIKRSELRSSIIGSLSESEKFIEDSENVDRLKCRGSIIEQMEAIVNAPLSVEDAIFGLFAHTDHALQQRAVEIYIRRLYQPFFVRGSMRMKRLNSGLVASWEFLEKHAERKNGCEDEVLDESFVGKHSERKCAAMAVIKSLEFFPTTLTAALSEVTDNLKGLLPFGSGHPTICDNIMHIALLGTNNQMSSLHQSGYEVQTQDIIKELTKVLKEGEISSSLQNAGVRVISSIIQIDDVQGIMRHSFHWSAEKLEYVEEPILRHLDPTLSSYLDLDKVRGFGNLHYTTSQDKLWHLYTVRDKRLPIKRMFLRGLVRQPLSTEDQDGIIQSLSTLSSTSRSILRSLMSAIDALELSFLDSSSRSDHAQIYLCILPEQKVDDVLSNHKREQMVGLQEEPAVEKILDEMANEINASIGFKMYGLGVREWEVKLWISSEGEANGAWRVVVTDITGQACIVHIYREVKDSSNKNMVYYSTSGRGPLHCLPVNAQYKPLGMMDQKRLIAWKYGTTYCYDFPLAFEAALAKLWIQHPGIKKPTDKTIIRAEEFIFADRDAVWCSPLVFVKRKPGLNDIGLVAWRMEMSTPEFPSGRTIIVISNDVNFKSGSFGPEENAFFTAVTNFACSHKLPLIYLAATSGSRIVMEDEVKSCFKVGWFNESNPQDGFEYFYFTPEDYSRIGSHVIAHELTLPNGEIRWVIDTILGKVDSDAMMKEGDLIADVINGTGAIARAYLRAYEETFTLTYVTGTTVGIGAYLARFGIRCIQRNDQPILLTGFSALNKLLKREVYSSNMQLGGPKIMGTNGVGHLTVSDDVEGISAILKWLSFVPPYSGGPLPSLTSSDPPERPVEYLPDTSCDPTSAIRGTMDANGKWLGGIFDKDSFIETQEGWARTVVTGRGKLGGIPVGIIAAETLTQMLVIPADPGQLDSCERVIPQAGQLWHPDSSTKAAQAILDFNHEGLPLFMLANWRGFSGGQKDLFEGIIQTGSEIVENLRNYRQPIFVYIPITGELRGGAWVTIDRNVNPDHVETYADGTAKGNILEPEGMIEIKFRTRDLLECMGRLDHKLMNLKLKCLEDGSSGTRETKEDLQKQIKSREHELLPVYTQVALKFADLHDTAATLANVGAIREIVEWTNSRSYFYKRLRRRTAENDIIKNVMDAAGNHIQYKSARDMIKSWFLNSKTVKNKDRPSWKDDEAFFCWKDDSRNYEGQLHDLRIQKHLLQLLDISNSPQDLSALPQSLDAFLEKVDPSIRDHLIDKLRRGSK